jgi:hypothetical protein
MDRDSAAAGGLNLRPPPPVVRITEPSRDGLLDEDAVEPEAGRGAPRGVHAHAPAQKQRNKPPTTPVIVASLSIS